MEHYGLRSASSFSSLHDLNADRDAVTGDSLDNDGDSAAVVSGFCPSFLSSFQ